MNKKFLFILATVVTTFIAIFCIVWAAIFNFNPMNPEVMNPMFNLLWCAFAGLGLVVAQRGSFKTLPNMLCSAAVGPLYGILFFGMLDFLMGNGFTPLMSFGICAVVVTYIITLLHVVVLEKTWFNTVAMTLGTYGIFFAVKNPADPTNYNWLYGAIFFMIGTTYATIFEPIAVAIMKKVSKSEVDRVEV